MTKEVYFGHKASWLFTDVWWWIFKQWLISNSSLYLEFALTWPLLHLSANHSAQAPQIALIYLKVVFSAGLPTKKLKRWKFRPGRWSDIGWWIENSRGSFFVGQSEMGDRLSCRDWHFHSRSGDIYSILFLPLSSRKRMRIWQKAISACQRAPLHLLLERYRNRDISRCRLRPSRNPSGHVKANWDGCSIGWQAFTKSENILTHSFDPKDSIMLKISRKFDCMKYGYTLKTYWSFTTIAIEWDFPALSKNTFSQHSYLPQKLSLVLEKCHHSNYQMTPILKYSSKGWFWNRASIHLFLDFGK